jgi:hypothetical protein
LSPGANDTVIVVVVTAMDVMVGAAGTIAETTKLTETSVAALKLSVSADEAVSVQVPANSIRTSSPLTVQTLVVALATVTEVLESSAVVEGATLNVSSA